MSSPGQKRGTCGHIMALFDNHKKCARCREKGVGDDPCVKKLDCQICKAFTPAQIQQLSTPTYQSRKEQDQKKTVTDSPASATPTLVDPSEVTLLGQVHKESASAESTPASKKKKRADQSPKASSKKNSSSKPRSDELKDLDEKWSERFARLEAMLISKTFAVHVEPVKKPSSVVNSDQPFLILEIPTVAFPLVLATQLVEAPIAGMATQPVKAPDAGPEVLVTGTSDAAIQADSDGDLHSEPGSPVNDNFRDGSPDRDFTRDD